MKTNFLNFKTMKTIKLFIIPMLFLALLASCTSDDNTPVAIIAEELITDVNVVFTNSTDATDVVTLTANSADGVVEPTLTTSGVFTANATYNTTVTIRDNVNNENILDEIIAEKDEHFFTYSTVATDLFTNMVRADNDEVRTDGELLGLNTVWTAGAAGTGTLTLQLIHEPTTVNDDNGFGSASGGEFDINNTWDITIQ